MKKIICIIIAFVAVVAVFLTFRNNAESYPYMYPYNMPANVPVSCDVPLNFRLYREYKKECVTVKVYAGRSVEGKEPLAVYTESFDGKNDTIYEVHFVWKAPEVPGDYTVEYYTGFSSGGVWHNSDEVLYTAFRVVDLCEEHTFVENADSVFGTLGVKSDCYNKGVAYRLCAVCGYEEPYELEYSHVYGSAKTVSNAGCSSVGYKTFKCTRCDETKVEILEPDTNKHSIRAVVKVEATATRPGSVWFECNQCNYVEPYKTETPALFMEVDPGMYYEKPVAWAYDKKAFSSIKGYTFVPDAECDKATVMSLMYILNGKGVTAEDVNPFTDVAEGNYFRDSAKWAYKYGIVEGDKFEPYKLCTRGMLVEYLWRMSGSPRATENHGFTDVPDDASYSEAVAWAVSEGIASGMDEGIFNPDWNCTQAQVVTFLYRVLYDENEEAE